MPTDPLFHFRRTKGNKPDLEFTIGRSFALVLVLITLLLVFLAFRPRNSTVLNG